MYQRLLSGPYSYTRIRLPDNSLYILLSDVHGSSTNQCSTETLSQQLDRWFRKYNTTIDFFLETSPQYDNGQHYSPAPLQDVRYNFRQCFDHSQCLPYHHVKFHPIDIRYHYPDDLGISGIWYHYTGSINKSWPILRQQAYLQKANEQYHRFKQILINPDLTKWFLFEDWYTQSQKTQKIRILESGIPKNIVEQIKTFISNRFYSKCQEIIRKAGHTNWTIMSLIENGIQDQILYKLAAYNGLYIMDYFAILSFEISRNNLKLVYAGYNHIRTYIEYLISHKGAREEIHFGNPIPLDDNIISDLVNRCNIMDHRFESVQ